MRWLFRLLLLLIILIGIYAGTAVASLKGLVDDTARGDTAAIMARVDLPKLRASLAEQIVRAHFRRIEQTRPVKTVERIAAPTVVDALLATLLTADNIARLLQRGTLPVGAAATQTVSLPALSSAGLEDVSRIIFRLRPKSPVQVQVLLDDTGQAAIRMHFQGTHWKLSGIDLPPDALEKLITGVSTR
jgi:Protein of unknown function (DUF2939)